MFYLCLVSSLAGQTSNNYYHICTFKLSGRLSLLFLLLARDHRSWLSFPKGKKCKGDYLLNTPFPILRHILHSSVELSCGIGGLEYDWRGEKYVGPRLSEICWHFIEKILPHAKWMPASGSSFSSGMVVC